MSKPTIRELLDAKPYIEHEPLHPSAYRQLAERVEAVLKLALEARRIGGVISPESLLRALNGEQ